MKSARAKMSAVAIAAIAIMAVSAASAQTAAPTASANKPSLDVAVTYDATLSSVVAGSRFTMQGGALQIHGRFYGG